MSIDCIFCQIVSGDMPAHRIWEDDKHLAFLSIYPNTEGFSVVIPKQHEDSYFAAVAPAVLHDLVSAAEKVARILDRSFSDVGRTGLIFEGFGVNHLHAKLFPMHGTKDDAWRRHQSNVSKYFDKYEGYISSHDHQRADDQDLAKLAERIRNSSAGDQ